MLKALRIYAGTLVTSALLLLLVCGTCVALIFRPGSPVLGEFLSGTFYWVIDDKGSIESSNTRDRLPEEYREVAKPGSDGYPTFHPQSSPSSFILMKEISQIPRRYLVVRRDGLFLNDALGLLLIYFLPVFLLYGLLFGLLLHAWQGWNQRKLATVLSKVSQGNLQARHELGSEYRQSPAQQGIFIAAKLVERAQESRVTAERSLIRLLENVSGALHPRFQQLRKQLEDGHGANGLEVFDRLNEDLSLLAEIRCEEYKIDSKSADIGEAFREEIEKNRALGQTKQIVLGAARGEFYPQPMDPGLLKAIARMSLECAVANAKGKVEVTLVKRNRGMEVKVTDDGGKSSASLEMTGNVLRALVESQGGQFIERHVISDGAEFSIIFPGPIATDLREVA